MMYLIEIEEKPDEGFVESVTRYPANSKTELLKLWTELLVLNVRKPYKILENNVVKLEGIMCPADFAEIAKWEEPVKSSGCENGACEIF